MGEHVGEDGRWLSYSELAQARGIRRATAIRITRRNRWRKQTGNDGTVRVLVPEDWEARSPVRREAVSEAIPPAVLEADPEDLFHEISALRVELVAAGQRADQAMALADRTLAQLADERVRSDQVRAQVDELRGKLAELREDDAARRAMSRWRRAWDGWRGR
jgi:hypothetical protein